MEYKLTSHRFALEIIEARFDYKLIWEEVLSSINAVTDQTIIECFNKREKRPKSLSRCINSLLKDQLVERKWSAESPIFQDDRYRDKHWRLDFAKEPFSIEIAFNHGEAISWNLLKPVMASELNHVTKEISTRIGIIVCATSELKERGGFDNSVGEYEKIERYLRPLNNILTVPLVLVGLRAPQTFKIYHQLDDRRHNVGDVVMEPRPIED